MNNKEEPKVHCIVLNKLPCDLVKGRTEWKLCKVFLTLSHSKQRIQDEKNTKRKYNPVLAFSVSNPSDTDRQTLNFNKGVVKDRLGFSVNGETVAALVDRVGEKETQWVLTTSEYLKHFSERKNLTIDTFFENEFEESKLEGSLPSLFKLQSVCNRTEVVLASPNIKPPTGEGSSKKPQSSSKGHKCKGEKTKEKNTTAPKVVSKVVPSQSKGDLNGNYPAAQSKYNDDIPQKVEITEEESSPNNKQVRESNVSLKCGHPTKEKQSSTTHEIISKKTELPPESPQYDCEPSGFSDENLQATTPKVIVKVKKKVSEYDQKSKPDPVDKDQACATPRVVIDVEENASEPDKVQKQNHQSKSHSSAGGGRKSEQNAISERRENASAATHDTGHRKHSGDSGMAKNFVSKGKRGCEGGRIEKGFNEKHPVKASAQKTVEQLRADINYPKTKQNSDPKKKDEHEYRGSLEKESMLSRQSFKPLTSLPVETSPHSKTKRRTSSDQDCASPTKRQRHSTEGDTTVHKQPSGKYSSNEKRSDSQHQNVAKIPTKSGTGADVHDSNENKGPSKLPRLPSTSFPRKKPASDSMTALIENHSETGTEVESCVDDKSVRASQSPIDVTSVAGTSNSPVKRHSPASGKDEYGDTKRRKHSSGNINSLSRPFHGKPQRTASRSLSMDAKSIKTTKQFGNISHEDRVPDMTSLSYSKQAKGTYTVKKGDILKHGGKTQSTFRSLSVESGSAKKVKEFDNYIRKEDKNSNVKSPSNSKEDGTPKKGSLNNSHKVDIKQKREDNPSRNNESQYEDTKGKRAEEQRNQRQPEIRSSMKSQSELKGDKATTNKAASDRDTSVPKQFSGSNHIQQKSFTQERRDVTLLVGDSTLQHIQPEKFFKNKRVCVKTVPGARVDNISDYITKFLRQQNPSEVILHIGANDLQKNEQHIAAHIESVGKLLNQTFHRVVKFTISSIIERRVGISEEKYVKASEVNRALRNLQQKHGWGYIDNGNIDPEIHVLPDGIHLNTSGIEAFAANISKHVGSADSNLALRCDSSLPSSKDQTAAMTRPKDARSTMVSPTKSCKDIISSRQDQPDEVPSEYSRYCAASRSKMSRGESTSCETKGEEEKFALLIGDSTLESILPHRLSWIKQTNLVVVPNAKVDTIGDIISTHARNPSCDEVILHVGSNDLRDGGYDPSVIASNIEKIGLNLQKTLPNIAAFTISGIISTYQFKYSDSRELNSQLKSLTSKHGWAYICNDNIRPEFNLKRRDPKLNQRGTRLFASNIIAHLRSEKRSSRCSTSSQHSIAKKGNVYQSTSKYISLGESTDAEHVNDPETEERPFVEKTHHPNQEHEQSGRYPGKHMKPHRGITVRVTERGRSCPQDMDPQVGDNVFRESPNSRRAWTSGAYRKHSDNNSDYSSSRRQRGAGHGTPPRPREDINALFPGYAGCYRCKGLDHKKADCPY